MKCFGCFIMASNVNRLSPRGLPCVFLGYPQTQKGYKLLDLKTNKLFVSRNVQFYKTIFPYRLFHKTTQQEAQTFHDSNLSLPDLCDDEYHIEDAPEPIHTDVPITNTKENEPTNLHHIQAEPAPPVRRSKRSHKTP